MLGQVIEKNKMLKAHILATGLPISSKLCGIAMCVPWAWFRKAYLLFMLKHWLIQVLEMRVPTVDCVIKHGGQANPICQLCQARDESKCILWPSAEMQKKYGTWWWYRIKWWSPMQVICKGSAKLHFSTLRAGVIGWSCTFVHNLLFFFRLYKL